MALEIVQLEEVTNAQQDAHRVRLHPGLAPYLDLKSVVTRSRELAGLHDVFLAESELTVRQLLASPCGVQSVLASTHQWKKLEAAVRERAAKDSAAASLAGAVEPVLRVYLAPEEVLQSIVGFAFHRGVLAAGERPSPPTLQQMLTCDTLTILEGLSNYDNVGAVFRNVACLAGSAQPPSTPGVVLGPGCCDPLYRKAIRVSIGHVLSVPFATAQHLVAGERRDVAEKRIWPGLLHTLREHGWRLLAMTPAGDTTLEAERARQKDVNLRAKIAVLVGAEGPGLSEEAMQACDARVAIPMRQGVDSLNVATALAVTWSWLR